MVQSTSDLIDSKITHEITKVSRTLPQNSLGTAGNKAENVGLHKEKDSKLWMI